MPDSMYDKLGELLSKALESGNFFTQNQESQTSTFQKPQDQYTKESANNRTTDEKAAQNTKSADSFTQPASTNKNRIKVQNKKLIKYAHFNVQKACALVGISEGMSYEEAKRVFRKKLFRFHPDRNADNEIMRKITKQKTEELLAAWKIIEEWYKT